MRVKVVKESLYENQSTQPERLTINNVPDPNGVLEDFLAEKRITKDKILRIAQRENNNFYILVLTSPNSLMIIRFRSDDGLITIFKTITSPDKEIYDTYPEFRKYLRQYVPLNK